MKTTYSGLMLAVILLAGACRKDLKENEVALLPENTTTSKSLVTPAWLISKVSWTDLITDNTYESVFSYNNLNKPVREAKVSREYNRTTRDTMLYTYNAAQQLIRYANSKWGSAAVLKYNAQGKLSAIEGYGEMAWVKYSYPNDTVVLADFGVRYIDLKPRIYSYATVIYFIYDRSGNLRYRRTFTRHRKSADEVPITDTTGIQPIVYAYGPYGNKAALETALNIPGPGTLGLLTGTYTDDDDYYPKFPANNLFRSRSDDKIDYIFNAAGLPVEVTISWSSGPVSRYKIQYIAAK